MAIITYPGDLIDAEWQLVAPLLLLPKPGECPGSVDLRRILNACPCRKWVVIATKFGFDIDPEMRQRQAAARHL